MASRISSLVFKCSSYVQVRSFCSKVNSGKRSITIHTCRKVYSNPENRKRFIFKHCPKDGIKINVDYLDIRITNQDKDLINGRKQIPDKDLTPDKDQSCKTILALHGAPGSYKDFLTIIQELEKSSKLGNSKSSRISNLRFLAPNFPTLSYTDQTGHFRHSTKEKSEYVADFLSALKIDKIDLLISHSSAIFPVGHLHYLYPDLIRSLIMINPPGDKLTKGEEPFWFVVNASRLNLHPIGRKIFKHVILLILKTFFKKQIAVNLDQDDNGPAHTGITMILADREKMKPFLNSIKIPTCFIFSSKDKLVSCDMSYDILNMLGGKPDDVNHIIDYQDKVFNQDKNFNQDKDFNLDKDTNQYKDFNLDKMARDNLKVICFDQCGHYAFKRFPKVIVAEIERLLR